MTKKRLRKKNANKNKMIKSVRKLTYGPNDTIVFSVNNTLSNSNINNIREALSHYFPNNKILIMDGSMKIAVMEDKNE